MGRMNLDEILERSQKGLAVSRGYVEKCVSAFIYGTVEEALPQGGGEQDVWEMANSICSRMGGMYDAENYVQTIVVHYLLYKHTELWALDDYYALGFIFSDPQSKSPFLHLTIEDYLCMAGLDEDYERYFKKEDNAYRKEHKHPLRLKECGISCIKTILECPKICCRVDRENEQGVEDASGKSVELALIQMWCLLQKAPLRWERLFAEAKGEEAVEDRNKRILKKIRIDREG